MTSGTLSLTLYEMKITFYLNKQTNKPKKFKFQEKMSPFYSVVDIVIIQKKVRKLH